MHIAQYRVEDNSYTLDYKQSETLQSIANKYNISIKDNMLNIITIIECIIRN